MRSWFLKVITFKIQERLLLINEQDSPIQLYLRMSGHVGDVPWTAILVRAYGHSSFKGCARCLQLVLIINCEGEPLGLVRCLGYLDKVLHSVSAHRPLFSPVQATHYGRTEWCATVRKKISSMTCRF
jgi:hypothetical protein